ncbi:uncharacterized protein DFL_008829 [Arthrobotrys flagrans]|uniref:Uncharacterized protein n=1 Tax=Arthrobotrys flagrans TaxID=97331 RepID=A0A436ZQ05_ARTFL|nr:hypothetical protein DFL_008829 [Arthrobotrys flagrans]
MPPKRKQTVPADEPSGTIVNPTSSRRRGNRALPEQELPSRRSQRSRGTVAATEAVASDVPEQQQKQHTVPVARPRRGKAAATSAATQQQPEPVVEAAPPPTRTRATRSTKTKAKDEAAEEVDQAIEQTRPSTEKTKKQTRKKKVPVPPSTRASRSRSNSATSIQSQENEAGEEKTEAIEQQHSVETQENQTRKRKAPVPPSTRASRGRNNSFTSIQSQEYNVGPTAGQEQNDDDVEFVPTTRKMTAKGSRKKAKTASSQETGSLVEATTEAAVAEASRPTRSTRSKAPLAKEKETEKPDTEVSKRPTRSYKRATEHSTDVADHQPRTKRQKVQSDQETTQAPKRRQGRAPQARPIAAPELPALVAPTTPPPPPPSPPQAAVAPVELQAQTPLTIEPAEQVDEEGVEALEEPVIAEEEGAEEGEEGKGMDEEAGEVESEGSGEQGAQYARPGDEDLTLTGSERGLYRGVDHVYHLSDSDLSITTSEVAFLEGREEVVMEEEKGEGEGGETPEEGAAINAGHTAQDGASPDEAESAAGSIVPQTPTRSAWGPWGHLKHQPKLSSPLKSYCITAQYSPPKEDTPVRERRVSENGIISLSGDPSPLRSEELLGRDFNTPVGSPSQLSPRMRPTPGPRRRARSRSVCGSSPLKNAVDFALDAEREPKIASPLARLVSDYDPSQDISELRIEEVPMTPTTEEPTAQEISELRIEEILMTPTTEEPVGNILDDVLEEQLLEDCDAVGSDESDDGIAAAPTQRPSQGFDGAGSPPEKPKRRSRLPVPKAIENLPSSPSSTRLKRVSQTKSLSDRELLKVTARNTTRNAIYKNAKFERKVIRTTRQRPPSPTRDTQSAAAEWARQLRQRVFEETGVALGPGDEFGYVPPQVSRSAKKVKWHERLEHVLDEEERAGFYTGKGILAPERVRRDSGTIHEITIQKILYEGEKDILDDGFEEGF